MKRTETLVLLSMAATRYKYLRQGISITGLGTATFEQATKSAQDIHDMFQRQFSEGRLGGWNTGKYRHHATLDMSNRYFTPKRDAPNMEHIPFDEMVDPQGVLEGMIQGAYVHGEENVVQYYNHIVDEKGNERWASSSCVCGANLNPLT
jgi:hypothetical protein